MKKTDKTKKLGPFDFINSINNKDGGEIIEENEKQYNSFIVNRFFSFFNDTIFFANEINRFASVLTNQQQFDFYYHALSKKRRYTKWVRENKSDKEEIDLIIEATNCSKRDAKELLSFIDETIKKTLLDKLKTEVYKGGKK